ncbi:platelet glycoprotein VI-like [Carettochelys insculpta]|uniref:platelet glycoprotein VI-like n=1 Tax=Carettochelys insculpta TaxID=44489 RepID=UPI003EB7BC53
MGHLLVLLLLLLSYKARLQVTPAGAAVPLGGRVSLHCLCQVPCTRLFLYRGPSPIPVQHAEARGQAAKFPIAHVGPAHAGSYRCRYLSRHGQPRWSENSDPVWLVVGGASLDSSPTGPPSGPTAPALLQHSRSPLPRASPDSSPTSPALRVHHSSPLPATPAPAQPLDFTQGNILRLGLATGVLLALGLILAPSCCSWERRAPWPKRGARGRGEVPTAPPVVPLCSSFPASLPTGSPVTSKAGGKGSQRDLTQWQHGRGPSRLTTGTNTHWKTPTQLYRQGRVPGAEPTPSQHPL